MEGSSQGSPYSERRATHCDGVSPKHCLTCAAATISCACRSGESRRTGISQNRPRVRIADARRVRQRVENHASPLGLRGARKHVLDAVLGLLCGWKRITDDQVRLRQITQAIEDMQGHCYDPKTVGRALAALAATDLITYQPARGRGNCAVIAIHPQFVRDVEILQRDTAGRVVVGSESVTFSGRRHLSLSISKKTSLPSAQTNRPQPLNTRPTEVDVDPKDVRQVVAQLPAEFRSMPGHLRWLLGGEIRKRLARGFLPEQILALLHAPLPDHVDKPWRLALWRLQHNSIGAGPRLTPLQRAWDRTAAEAKHRADVDAEHRRLTAITDVTDAEQRERLLTAFQRRLPAAQLVNRNAMLVQASRLAQREFPTVPLAAALTSWSAEILKNMPVPAPTPSSQPVGLVDESLFDYVRQTCADGTCLSCQAASGPIRHALPIPAPICNDCWIQFADTELLEDVA